ncbi:MAG: CHAT domain-containing protein [Flavobacterium sp.]|nr:CHAT domain-containing protein [Flavobacterium sp.]
MRQTLLLILFSQLIFSQKENSNLIDKSYQQTDVVIANPTRENLNKLEEFVTANTAAFNKTKNQNELLAFVYLKCNCAYYENQFGQTQKAILNYEKAWQIFDTNKLKGYDIIEFCQKPLGNLYTIIGDYENAENTIKHYFYNAAIDNNSDQKFAALLNLTAVYVSSGKVQEAIDLLVKTIVAEKFSASQKGRLWNNLGNCYVSNHNVYQAKKAFQTSITLLESQDETAYLSNSYRNLALLNNDFKGFEKSKKLFLENPKNTIRSKAKFYLDEANLHFNTNQFEKSTEAIKNVFKTLITSYNPSKNSLPTTNQVYAETLLIDAFDLQGTIYLTQNKSKKALECFTFSFTIEDLLQSLLVYENSKIVTQLASRNRTEKCIFSYNELYKSEHKISYLEKAFQLAETQKASVLKANVSNNLSLSRDEKLIKTQLQNQNTIIIKEQEKQENASISIINKAIKKQNELMLLLKSNSKNNKSTGDATFNLKDLFAKLESQKAMLVSYFLGDKTYYIFTVEKNRISLKSAIYNDQSKLEIRKFIDFFGVSDAITNNVDEYTKTGFKVYKMLGLPNSNFYQKLVILPDGILHFLPFEALITQESTTTNFAKINYLVKSFTIGYFNSALFYLDSKPVEKNNPQVLGMFPIFENSPLELTYSKTELKAIQDNFTGKFLVGSTATFANFKKDASNYDILHLSTHGSSGSVENPASIKFYDQEIAYSELYNLDIKASLVVLSACETGLGKLYSQEGALSISRGFQMAGAQNLLFSLWKVNDYTTSVLMEKFYKNCAKQMSYFESNHQSKLDYLSDNTISNSKKSPYYWSAFVYYGTLDEEKPTNYFWILFIFGGFIALFLSYKFIKNARFSKNIKKR